MNDECVPDDFGATRTVDGRFLMLWERYGRTVTIRFATIEDGLRFHRDPS
jgi:hypothetical protein